jgi:hypothetical protein
VFDVRAHDALFADDYVAWTREHNGVHTRTGTRSSCGRLNARTFTGTLTNLLTFLLCEYDRAH